MASFEWPVGKLELINGCLAQTGNNLVDVADNGSDEWIACSPAYERALGVVTEAHSWSWLTNVRTLQPAGTVPADDQFDTAYPLPPDLIHLIWVRIADLPCVWGLLNGQLVVNSQGGPPPPDPAQAPAAVTIKGIFSTNSDLVNGTPTVVMAMEHFVFSAIYRGLHKDPAEAGRMMAVANQILTAAKTRHDQQLPKRAMFNSRIAASRRMRRPWPPVPGGWGGTGQPG
jgi:hypothetical protein